MHALVKGAVFAAALSLAGIVVARRYPEAPPSVPAATPSQASAGPAPAVLTEMPCPARHLPEGQACVPVPDLDDPIEGPSAEVHRDRRARGPTYEVLPRKPDRSADPFAYAYPLEDEPLFLRGYDETIATDASPVSLELAAERGTKVHAVALDLQDGPSRVVAVGRLVGTTVVTRHEIHAPDRTRIVLLVFGHLDAVAPDLKVGTELGPTDLVGFVGDSGDPGVVSLYLEARQVRQDMAIEKLPLERLVDPATSIPTDLRNVLALR